MLGFKSRLKRTLKLLPHGAVYAAEFRSARVKRIEPVLNYRPLIGANLAEAVEKLFRCGGSRVGDANAGSIRRRASGRGLLRSFEHVAAGNDSSSKIYPMTRRCPCSFKARRELNRKALASKPLSCDAHQSWPKPVEPRVPLMFGTCLGELMRVQMATSLICFVTLPLNDPFADRIVAPLPCSHSRSAQKAPQPQGRVVRSEAP